MSVKVFKSINMKSYPFHPLMIAFFQILTIYAINVNIVNKNAVVVILLLSTSVTALLFIFVSYITNDIKRAAVAITFYCFLFFTYGRLYDAISVLPMFKGVIGRHRYLFPLYIMIIIFGTLWIFRSQLCIRYIGNITYFLNTFSIVLVLVSVSIIIKNYDRNTFQGNIHSASNGLFKENKKSKDSQGRGGYIPPNVYFFIFDSYSSHRVLNRYYDWDDIGVVDALRTRGFIVNKNAYSNYPFTFLSVAATLNMQYIHEDSGFKNAFSKMGYLSQHIKHNEVMERFKSEGYEISSSGAFYPKKKYCSVTNTSVFSDEFVDLIIQVSFLRILEYKYLLDKNRIDILAELEYMKLSDVPKKPTFVFSHVMCPHMPQSFNADGSRPNFYDKYQGALEKKNYVEQVRFIGTQIIEIIDSIRRRDPRAAIIVQSDHGFGDIIGNHLFNREMPPKEFIDAQYGILSAIYMPPEITMPEVITPVNLFRYIVNNLFDARYEMLPDRVFFTPYKEPFEFYEVTNEINRLMVEQSGANGIQ